MVELADEGLAVLLSVGGQVDVCEVVALQGLVTADVVGFEDGEWEAGKATGVDLVGRKPCGGVYGVVVGRGDVQQQHVPIGLLFVAEHGEHLGQGVVDALDAAVGAGVVGAGVDLVDPKAVVNGAGKLGSEVESVVRELSLIHI